jgi:hypothetical protein
MKTLKEIKKLTTISQKSIEKRKREAEAKAKSDALLEKKSYHKKIIDYIHQLMTVDIPKEIEKSARNGHRSHTHEFVHYCGKYEDEEMILFKKHIKKHFSDYNPTYGTQAHNTCDYNYDGNSIDGTERTYYNMTVTFSW